MDEDEGMGEGERATNGYQDDDKEASKYMGGEGQSRQQAAGFKLGSEVKGQLSVIVLFQ